MAVRARLRPDSQGRADRLIRAREKKARGLNGLGLKASVALEAILYARVGKRFLPWPHGEDREPRTAHILPRPSRSGAVVN
jgi:hypothetical protein